MTREATRVGNVIIRKSLYKGGVRLFYRDKFVDVCLDNWRMEGTNGSMNNFAKKVYNPKLRDILVFEFESNVAYNAEEMDCHKWSFSGKHYRITGFDNLCELLASGNETWQ